ncbi:hypothetical protein WMF26_06895 [Sorangium sp. So ce185]
MGGDSPELARRWELRGLLATGQLAAARAVHARLGAVVALLKLLPPPR